MAKRRTRGRMTARIEDGERPPLDVTTDVEMEISDLEVMARVGSIDPPARATDPKTVRMFTYVDACTTREAERQAHIHRPITSRFKAEENGKRGKGGKPTTPLPRVPCPACGGDLPHCALCGGEGEVKAEQAEAWRLNRFGHEAETDDADLG